MNETLRLIPPIIDVPKIASQQLEVAGKTYTVPKDTFIHTRAVGARRNTAYWPRSSSKVSTKPHDLGDFVPERWLNPSGEFFTPVEGSYIPFSEGSRARPGRRFAQVEITAVLAVVSKIYTIELDVIEWAGDKKSR
jgi:cytochrome P450